MAVSDSKKYVIHLTTEGESTLLAVAALSLEKAQQLVAGNIESVPFKVRGVKPPLAKKNKWVLVCNEEGLCLGLPLNPFVQGICGNIVLCQMAGTKFVGFGKDEVDSLPLSIHPNTL